MVHVLNGLGLSLAHFLHRRCVEDVIRCRPIWITDFRTCIESVVASPGRVFLSTLHVVPFLPDPRRLPCQSAELDCLIFIFATPFP